VVYFRHWHALCHQFTRKGVSRPPKVYVSLLTISSSFPTAPVKRSRRTVELPSCFAQKSANPWNHAYAAGQGPYVLCRTCHPFCRQLPDAFISESFRGASVMVARSCWGIPIGCPRQHFHVMYPDLALSSFLCLVIFCIKYRYFLQGASSQPFPISLSLIWHASTFYVPQSRVLISRAATAADKV